MKTKLTLLIFAAAIGFAIVAQAAVLRVTTSGLGSTNNTSTSLATIDQYGTLYRAVITTSGGSCTVSLVDSDGTSLISTTALAGSYTWTGTSYMVKPTVKTQDASATNVSVSVKLTVDK